MNNDAIVIETVYPHPVAEVWEALTSSEALATWLMPNDFQPRVGHRFSFRTTPDQMWSGVVECEVITLDSPHQLAFTWVSGPLNTLVTLTIEPVEGGTHLRLEHSGFAASGKVGFTIRDALASGWNSKILRERLPELLNQRAAKSALNNTNDKKETST